MVQQCIGTAEHPIQKQQVNFIYLWVNIQNQMLLLTEFGTSILHLPSYPSLPQTEAVQPHVLIAHERS